MGGTNVATPENIFYALKPLKCTDMFTMAVKIFKGMLHNDFLPDITVNLFIREKNNLLAS